MGWTSGKFGPAGNFNGTSASVNMGNSSALDPSNLTVEAWIYPTNVGSEQSVARKSTSSSDSGLIYDLLVQGDGVYLRLNGNNGYVRSNTHLQNNQWYHIAGTYDGNTIRIYINGVLDNSVSYSLPLRPSSGIFILAETDRIITSTFTDIFKVFVYPMWYAHPSLMAVLETHCSNHQLMQAVQLHNKQGHHH